MANQEIILESDSDPYITTAVDALTAALQSGTAGPLSVSAPDVLRNVTREQGHFTVESILGAPETPLASLIDGYGSDESKRRLANAVGRILLDESALLVTDLHEWSSLGDAARAINRRLQVAPPAFRCTSALKHSFRERGTGLCIFDGSPLVRA